MRVEASLEENFITGYVCDIAMFYICVLKRSNVQAQGQLALQASVFDACLKIEVRTHGLVTTGSNETTRS